MFAFTNQDGPIEYLSDLHFALQVVEIDTAKCYKFQKIKKGPLVIRICVCSAKNALEYKY